MVLLCTISVPTLAAANKSKAAHQHTVSPQFDAKVALKISQSALGRTLGNYQFTDRNGKKVRLKDYQGRPLIISMIYTSCHHICPTTTLYLAKIVGIARDALGPNSFTVLTIGFDIHNDTPAAMQAFAKKQGIAINGWKFLSTDKRTIQRLSRDLGFQYFASAKGFDHLVQATVVDQQGKIYRQVYGTRFDTPLLVEPLKELVFGRPVKHSIMTSISNKIRLFCTVYDPVSGRYKFDYSIFIGMAIGIVSLGVIILFLIREWRRLRSSKP